MKGELCVCPDSGIYREIQELDQFSLRVSGLDSSSNS